MINLTLLQKRSLDKWQSCIYSGMFVKMEVITDDTGEASIINHGFCRKQNRDVDHTLDCLYGLCWKAYREPPRRRHTPTRRARIKNQNARARSRLKERVENQWRQSWFKNV